MVLHRTQVVLKTTPILIFGQGLVTLMASLLLSLIYSIQFGSDKLSGGLGIVSTIMTVLDSNVGRPGLGPQHSINWVW